MRKSTRPASGTSKPCSHIPDTRYYKGDGGAMAVTGTFFLAGLASFVFFFFLPESFLWDLWWREVSHPLWWGDGWEAGTQALGISGGSLAILFGGGLGRASMAAITSTTAGLAI